MKENTVDRFDDIRQWATDRNIFEGSDVKSQFVKLAEEMGELGSAIAKGRPFEFCDAVGDMVVVLTILSEFNGVPIEECIDEAWHSIKNRKGRMVDGVFIKED